MLARRLATILPAMTLAETIETTYIHRIVGLTGGQTALVAALPFRAPYRPIPAVGLEDSPLDGVLGPGSMNANTAQVYVTAMAPREFMPQPVAMDMATACIGCGVMETDGVRGERIHTHRGRCRFWAGVSLYLDSGSHTMI
jgi:hypothetical protein